MYLNRLTNQNTRKQVTAGPLPKKLRNGESNGTSVPVAKTGAILKSQSIKAAQKDPPVAEGHALNSANPSEAVFRRDTLQKCYLANSGEEEIVEEELGASEVMIDGAADYELFGEQIIVEEVVEEEPKADLCKFNSLKGICLFTVGQIASESGPEMRSLLKKAVGDASRVKVQIDNTVIDKLTSEDAAVDHQSLIRIFSDAQRGNNMLMEVMQEKMNSLMVRLQQNDVTNNLTTTIFPENFSNMQELKLVTLDGSELSVTGTFARMKAFRGGLKRAVQRAGTFWLNTVIPISERKYYTTSDTPRGDLRIFPAELINMPAAVLADGIQVTGHSDLRDTIGLLFLVHIKYLLYASRYTAKRRHTD